MSDSVIVGIIGLLGVIISSLLSHTITKKQCDLQRDSLLNQNMIELITKYKVMCDDLEKKVNTLESKVDKLEKENATLKQVLSDHGLTVIAVEGE